MIDLRNINEIRKLDPKDVLGSTQMLSSQCKQIWKENSSENYIYQNGTIKNIVICGMGGSAYGAHIATSLLKDELKVPIYTNSEYHLPSFVNEESLVILTSYSGSTEEVLNCAREAFEKNAKIIGLTSGSKIREFMDLHNLPGLVFDPKYNPSQQPRLGTGYIVFGTLVILNNLGLINILNRDIENALKSLEDNQEKIQLKAIEIAQKLYNKIPVIFASQFLSGNSHIIRNQFNETAKSFSAFSLIPELNHHLMEGLKNPRGSDLHILFLTSPLYDENIKKRITLTKDVIEKNKVGLSEYILKGESKLSDMLETLSFGGYVTFYLALLYNQDPSVIPWVDYFKEQLALESKSNN